MNKTEYTDKHIKVDCFVGHDVVMIECGHERAGVYSIQLRQDNPTVQYICCRGCYHMISGDMIERAFTVKMK